MPILRYTLYSPSHGNDQQYAVFLGICMLQCRWYVSDVVDEEQCYADHNYYHYQLHKPHSIIFLYQASDKRDELLE